MKNTKQPLPNIGDLIGRNVVIRYVTDDLPRITTGVLGIHPHDLLTQRGELHAVTVANRRILLRETFWIVPEADENTETRCDAARPDRTVCTLVDHPATPYHVSFGITSSVRWSR